MFISNDDLDDIIKIVESLETSGLLIDRVSETVKHEIKKEESGFFPTKMTPMAVSLVAPMVSSLINSITGKRQQGEFLPLLALPITDESIAKNSYKSWKRKY